MERVVISGTFCPGWAAAIGYRGLATYVDADAIWSIPSLGLGHCLSSAELLAERLPDHPVDLIGHSQGGLLAVLVASLYPERVRRVVSLGGPLVGGSYPSLPVASIRCMRFGSRLLERLVGTTAMLSIGGGDDTLVPVPATQLPGAYCTWVPQVGHLGLIHDNRVYRIARTFLEEKVIEIKIAA